MTSAPAWKIKELIAALGGVMAIGWKLEERGIVAPPYETIAGWKRRDSAPGNWVLTLLMIAQEENILPPIHKLRREA
jgi:hypothetical protein